MIETDIRIRAFRATDDYETCLKFIEGHKKVLAIYGIENITTNVDDWIYNPSIFVVVVESMDKQKLFGGARIQCADGIRPLPIQEAVGEMDERVNEIVAYNAQFGACELCGLWNSKEVAGLGIGSFFPAIVAVSITQQIGINVLFALCSPFTTRFKDWIGGVILTNVGKNGTFYYPKLDLIATVLFSDGLANLPLTIPRVRDKMIHLRQNPNCTIREKSPLKTNM